jgi:sugar (pentulose or hexulose) kinase
MAVLLGVDAGTTSLKVGLFGDDGAELAVAGEEYALLTTGPDRAELDPETYWQALATALRRVFARASLAPREVTALAVSSQGETVIALDDKGRAIGPAIVWLDNRAAAEADELAARFGREAVYAATGVPAVVPTWTACKLLWLKRHDPATFRAAARFLLVEDYLLWRLSGRHVSEGGVQCTSLLYDIREGRWWDPMLTYLELTPDRLPELSDPGAVIGELQPSAARDLGLPAGIPVVAAGMDQGAGAVGVGNVRPGSVSESTGGALTLQATIERADGDATRQTPVYVHSARGQYLYCPVCPTGGLALTWFRDRFGEAESAAASHGGPSAYERLTELAAGVPAGAEGLTMLPHLMGAFSPEYVPQARGVFFGFTLAHGKAHFVRAILESVAFMLRRNLELLAAAGAPASEVHSHGGGARSRLWCQIKADVCGLPIVTLAGTEAAIRGDAMLAGTATGVFDDLAAAADAMVARADTFAPDAGAHAVYERAYQRYRELFDAVRPLFVFEDGKETSAGASARAGL